MTRCSCSDSKCYADSFQFGIEIYGVSPACSPQSTLLPGFVRHVGFVWKPAVNPYRAKKNKIK